MVSCCEFHASRDEDQAVPVTTLCASGIFDAKSMFFVIHLLCDESHDDNETVRVLSKLGRHTGKGNRWTQARAATVRCKHHITAPAAIDPDILNLAQAQKHTGVSDTTLMRLIRANLLAVQQVAPYAPLEVKRMDLDSEPEAGIIEHLKATGRLVLTRDPWAEQAHLFQEDQ